MPYMPLELGRRGASKSVFGLLDSGASINVSPYRIGLDLGAVWEEQTPLFGLSGNLANYEARGLILNASVADFPAVKLAFGWTKSNEVPVILGQVNFFSLFDVCFFRADNEFEVKVR